MKSGSPSRTTAAHKTQTKIQAWSSLVFHCRHSSFNPSEAPPWDSRPVSGAGVVHYHLLHRPRSVPTALGPAPLATYPHRPSQAGGYPRDCALLPPLLGGARQGGRGVPGGKDRRDERKGDRRMRSDREERGEREKKKTSRSGSRTHCRSVLNQLSGSYSRCLAMVLDIFGGRLDTPPPSGRRRWLLQSRAAGSESPVLCSSPNLADGSRLRPTGEWRRLLRSLSDGSHPSSSQEHGSEPSVPPALPLLQHHRLGQPLAVSASPCCPISSARDPPQQRGLSDSVSLLPRGFRHQCNEVSRYGKKEAGTGEHLKTLIIK